MKNQVLLEEIELVRAEMIKTGNTYGINSAQALKVSQSLDKLIVAYQKKMFRINKLLLEVK